MSEITTTAADRADGRKEAIGRAEPRNFLILAAYQIVMRIGWIFKTETLVMPAFLDFILPDTALRAVVRGVLPVLNRFGHSIPPVLFARRLGRMKHKKWAFVTTTAGMSAAFLLLAGLWIGLGGGSSFWFAGLFLLIYALFFVATGINHLAFNTLQGKLIKATRRGRLMSVATAIGCPAAILAAWLLLEPWLEEPVSGFGFLFGICGAIFAIAAICAALLREPGDPQTGGRPQKPSHLRDTVAALRDDRNLRRLATVAALFSVVLMLFPHYQALARERLGLQLDSLLLWLAVQNGGTALFTLLAGPIADARGNRTVLRTAVVASALAPLTAVGMTWLPLDVGRGLFWLAFAQLGLTPVTLKVLANYTLEICEAADHPRYVSTVSFCVALPVMLLSPVVGLLVSQFGFEGVFLAGTAVILGGGILASRLIEPRHHVAFPASGVAVTAEE